MSAFGLAAQIVEFGKPLEVAKVPKPTAGPGEVVVRILVRPIHLIDYYTVAGRFVGFQPKSFPAVAGTEGMGVVDSIGEGVKDFKVGQRVFPLDFCSGGSLQEFVVVKEESLLAIPDEVSNEAASQFRVNPLTVWGLFDQAKIPSGGILVHNASGSEVGRMIIFVAKWRGIKCVSLVRREAQVEELKKEGSDYVFCTTTQPNFAEEIKKIAPEGVNAFFDAVNGNIASQLIETLKPGGIMIVYGGLTRENISFSPLTLFRKKLRIEGFVLGVDIKPTEQRVKDVMEWMKSGKFAMHIGEKFSLKDINQAMEASMKDAKPGQVLVYTDPL